MALKSITTLTGNGTPQFRLAALTSALVTSFTLACGVVIAAPPTPPLEKVGLAPTGLAKAGLAALGNPPIDRFVPDLDIYPQHFAIVQDAQGIIYLGSIDGVVEYDGESWRLIRLPNGEMTRSLAVGADGRIYVGGYNIFGYLTRDATGENQFVDLSVRFKDKLAGREFADIWETLVAPEGVYFRALNDVFFVNPANESTAHWQHEGRFGLVFRLGDKTLLQFRGEGMRQRVAFKGDANDWKALPYTSALKDLVTVWVPLADGARLGAARDGTWWRLDAASVSPAVVPEALKPASLFTRGAALADRSIALTTQDGRLFIVDPTLKDVRQFKLNNTYLPDVIRARDEGLLAVGYDGIHRVIWPAEWTLLAGESTFSGTLQNIVRWQDAEYLLTSSGVSRAKHTVAGIRFEAMPWKIDDAYDLLGLDANRALVAGGHHLYAVDKSTTQRINKEPVYPRTLVRSRFHPTKVFVGTERGLAVLSVDNNNFKLSRSLPQGIAVRILTIIEQSASQVLVGSERHGVWRFTLDSTGEITDANRIGEQDGLLMGQVAEAVLSRVPLVGGAAAGAKQSGQIEQSIMASTRKGLFRLEGNKWVSTPFDGLGALLNSEETLITFVDPKGTQRAYSGTRIFYREPEGRWVVNDVRMLRKGAFLTHLSNPDGQTIYLATESLLVNQTAKVNGAPPPKVLLRQAIQLSADGKRTALAINGGAGSAEGGRPVVQLAEGQFSLVFNFALPQLAREGSKRYQSRLVGSEEQFSEWSTSHRFTYASLPPKDYRLEVRAMDAQGRISVMTPFEFSVAAPWYMTVWARLLMVLTILVGVAVYVVLFTRYRTRRLEGANVELETKVEERTRALADAIQRLDKMAHIDGLTGIANRRRLDEYLPVVWAGCLEQQKPLSVLLIDVDHFKVFNDEHGHLAGDQVLAQIAERLTQSLRRLEDLLARYGGEEFIVVLPGADIEVAATMAETMRQTIEASTLGVTISVGVCSRVPDGGTAADLIAAADKALYVAKREGRNAVRRCGEQQP
jgi:diguanylate cyclase (GGDEF)-like protein